MTRMAIVHATVEEHYNTAHADAHCPQHIRDLLYALIDAGAGAEVLALEHWPVVMPRKLNESLHLTGEEDPRFTLNGQVQDLLEGLGAADDHMAFRHALAVGGLCEPVLTHVHQAVVGARQRPARAPVATRLDEVKRHIQAAAAAPTPDQPANTRQVGGTHYKDMAVQPWAVIDTWPLEQRIGFYRGNLLRYTMRMGSKDAAVQEIAKAGHYAQKLAEVLAEAGKGSC